MPFSPEIVQTIHMCRHCFMCRHANPTFLVTKLDAHTPRGYALGLSRINDGLVDWTEDQATKLFQSTMDGLCSHLCEFHWREDLVVQAGREEAVRVGMAPMAVERAAELRRDDHPGGDAASKPPVPIGRIDREGASIVYLTGRDARISTPGIITSTASILDRLGCDWTLLDMEPDPGIDLWELGYTTEAQEAAGRMAARLVSLAPDLVVTGSSRVLRALRELLPAWGFGPLPAVEHITEFLLRQLDSLLGDSGIVPRGDGTDRVAYHDPCALGRRLSVLDAPRRLIEGLSGQTPAELFHSGELAECCGGGGLLPELDPVLSARLAAARLARVLEVGARTLVTACPTCRATLAREAEDRDPTLEVLDIVEFVAARLGLTGTVRSQSINGGS